MGRLWREGSIVIVCDMSGDKMEIRIKGETYRFCFPYGCAPIRINESDEEIKAHTSKHVWNVIQGVRLGPVSVAFGKAFCSSKKSRLYGNVITALWSCSTGCLLFHDVARTKEEVMALRQTFIDDVVANGGSIVGI